MNNKVVRGKNRYNSTRNLFQSKNLSNSKSLQEIC